MATAAQISTFITANQKNFEQNLEKARAAANRFQKSAIAINRKLKKIGKQAQNVGKKMTMGLTAPIALLGVAAVKTFAEFEQEMAKVQAVSGATGKEFKALQTLAEELGESTRFTATEVATLQLNYSKLGFVPAQIEKITKPTLELALATGEDLANSAEVAGGVLRAFGKTAEQMPNVVDVMANSFSSSALNLEKFKDAMKSAAPVANAVGASLEETTAVISTMVDANIDASTAGTSLRNMFLELSAKGLTWKQAMDKIKGSSDKAATANALFGKRAVAAALVIAENTDKVDELTESYNKSKGSAARMARIMDNTLQGSMLRMKSALEGVAISFGRTLAPIISKVAGGIAELAQRFSAMSPFAKRMSIAVAGITAIAGPLLVVLGTMATAVAAISAPILLIVGGIAALALGVAAWSAANSGAADGLRDVRVEMNAELNLLKKGNITQTQRKKLIEGINEKYGDYLPNLLTEKSTLEEINKAQIRGNEALLKKISLMAKQEILAEAQQDLVDAEKAVFKTQLLIEKQNARSISTFEKVAMATLRMAWNGATLEEVLRRQKVTAKEATDEFTRLNGKYGEVAESAEAAADAIEKTESKKGLGNIGGSGGEGGDLTGKLDKNRVAFNEFASSAMKDIDAVFLGVGTMKQPAEEFEGALEAAMWAARDMSLAFDETPTQILERQRDALKKFIDEATAGEEPIDAATQKMIEQWKLLTEQIDKAKGKQVEFKTISEQTAEFMENALPSAIASMGEALGEAIAGADPSEVFKEFVKGLLQQLKQLGSVLIATGVPLMLAVATMPEGIKQVAAGTALITAATAGMAMFAAGGLVSGPVMGMVGEGRGTSRSNPEVIAPLDKLQGMMGGGSQNIRVTGEIVGKGSSLRAVLRNADIRSGLTNGGTNLKG